jgi:hypothetical protein
MGQTSFIQAPSRRYRVLLYGDDELLGGVGHVEFVDAGETRGGEHLLVLGEGEGVARRGVDEHHHRKGSRGGG